MKRFLFAIAAIALSTVPADLVQAQICPNPPTVPPSSETRVYRNQRVGFSFQLPANYRTMALAGGRVDVLDPSAYEWAQCIIRNREATEFKMAPVSVEVKSVTPGNRRLEAIVRSAYPWVTGPFNSTRVSNQAAITASYNETLSDARVKDVYFLTPNKRYLIRVSGPEQGAQLNLALSSLAFK